MCQQFLTDMQEVAAHLGSDVPAEEPPAELLDHIRAAIAQTPQNIEADSFGSLRDFDELSATRREPERPELRRRSAPAMRRHGLRRPSARMLVGAAGLVAILAVGGVSGYAVNVASDRDHQVAALQTDRDMLTHLGNPGAYSVSLTSGGAASAAAVVDGRDVYLVVRDLGRNDRSSSIYVLWAAKSNGSMVAVNAFDVKSDGSTIVHAKLPADVTAPRQFGVTHETGRSAPPVPGAAVLNGSDV
jgi:hypothetical protein